jgi:formylglycine-generating enzyme required for sulfatase activity
MPINPQILTRRYPGVTPFEREQQHLFFGRDREIADLLRLVSLERLLVLFGKSGHGKSSLLNAGVLPRLGAAFRGKSCVALSIRLGAYAKDQSLSPKDMLLSELERACAPAAGTDFYERIPTGRTLWREFKRRQPAGGSPAAFVLLFDQFEEFFLYPPEQQQQFRQEISELLYTEIPQTAFHEFDRLDEQAQDHLSAPLEVHAVFAIRSDRLHLLDSMKQELPAILHKRYELRGLNPEQAKAAMVHPAEAEGDTFDTKPFGFQPEALDAIVANLARGGAEETGQIESFQLQIVCQSIEDDVRARNRRGEKRVLIAPADLPDFGKVFENYYATRIASLGDDELERSARLLLEEELLYVDEAKGEARRLSMDGDALAANLLAKHGRTLPPALLDALVNSFIVRREKTARGTHYEISHDTLVGAVLKSREERRRTEKEAAERERLRVEAERQRQERLKLRRARNRNLAVGIGALLLLAWASWQTVQAGRSTQEAEKQKKVAEERSLAATLAEQEAAKKDSLAREATRIAELKTKEALSAEEKAELATLEARQQQRLAQAASIDVVKNLLKDARTDVLHLQYPAAVAKLKSAAEIGQLRDSVGLALMEPAFWFLESGQTTRFNELTGLLARLLNKKTPGRFSNRDNGRQFLRDLSGKRYKELGLRYYPDMVFVKGGTFQFGQDDESEGITASVSDFKIARTETTFWQFGLYCAATGRNVQDFSPGWGIDGDNPVVNVNWYQAVEYANWLSAQNGLEPAYTIDSLVQDTNNSSDLDYIKWLVTPRPGANGYRLPTETQWEYAARGGIRPDNTRYAGSNDLNEVAWHDVGAGNSTIDGVSRSRGVKQLKDNSLGLHDMSGNVWEWCWDWYNDYPLAPPLDYTGPESGSSRCLRGGSWNDDYDAWFEVGDRRRRQMPTLGTTTLAFGFPRTQNNPLPFYSFTLLKVVGRKKTSAKPKKIIEKGE